MVFKCRKSQYAIELISIIGVIVIAMIVFVWMISGDDPSEQSDISKAKESAGIIAGYANRVSEMGLNNKLKASVEITREIQSIEYNTSFIMVHIETSGGVLDFMRQTKSQLVGYNFSSTQGFMHYGIRDVLFESFGNKTCVYPPGNRTVYCCDAPNNLC